MWKKLWSLKLTCVFCLAALALVLGVSGCSVGYVVEAALTQSSILLNREPIEDLLKNTPVKMEPIREKLELVLAARNYALAQNLQCGGSFSSYSPIDGEALSWVVAAAYPLELKSKTWWFPIVGTVPYKGYFEKADALDEAKKLKKDDFEVSVRGVTAFSTLGWFDDPVLTPLLRTNAVSIVNTVIHETVHSTAWIPSSVSFNESLAHFVSLYETIKFFNSSYCSTDCQSNQKSAEKLKTSEFQYAAALERLHAELETIFSANSTPDKTLASKKSAYQLHLTTEVEVLNESLAESANNAEFLQEYIYHQYFTCFEHFRKEDGLGLSAGEFVLKLQQSWNDGKFQETCPEADVD